MRMKGDEGGEARDEKKEDGEKGEERQQIEGEQVRDLCAIGKAAALDPEDAPLANLLAKFGQESRLADTGLADNADHLAAAVFNLPQEVVQDREFALAVDKNSHASRCRLAQPGAPMGDAEQAICQDRLGFTFEGERPHEFDPGKTFRQ